MPSPDFQLTPSGLEEMDEMMAEREKGEIEEREGLFLTPTLKVWVSIIWCPPLLKTGATPTECKGQKNVLLELEIHCRNRNIPAARRKLEP